MTPETIRIVSQLRKEFYSLFAAAMKVSVSITTSNPSIGNPPIVSWIDERERLNYLRIHVHTAPDKLIPERPFILRVSVNKGGGISTSTRWKRNCQGLNQTWHFELTLLPEEILDFLPWIVDLVQSDNKSCTSFLQEPPHPLHFKMTNVLSVNDAWTQKAWQFALSNG